MGGVQNDLKKLIQNKIAPEKRSDFYLCDPDGFGPAIYLNPLAFIERTETLTRLPVVSQGSTQSLLGSQR